MDLIQLKLCDIQGRLFELSLQAGYGSEDFMKRFMRSKVARDLDSEYNRMQWAGEEYLLEEFADECPQTQKGNARYDREVMYWTGYLYRYWHILTNEPSREIYAQAPAKTIDVYKRQAHGDADGGTLHGACDGTGCGTAQSRDQLKHVFHLLSPTRSPWQGHS